MTYAYDLWAQMPVRDLYDTLMMAMAINAAKDMYDKGQLEIKDFRKEYGDFWSPTQSHMDFYNREFNVGGFLDNLYKQGIDPLRSKEGRMLVQQYINSRPYAKLNNMKKSAQTYELYEKNMADLARQNRYNQAFEDYMLGGKNILNLGENEVWDRMSPVQYQDLNEYTGHIFDKMDDSFISTDKDTGLDWYGVSRDRRAEALTSQLGGLLSSPLGLFHYEQSRKNAEAILGRKATEAEVLNQFKDDILTATKEYEHKNFKENAEYKRLREWEYDKMKAGLEHYYRTKENGDEPPVDDSGVSMLEWGYNNALANALGGNYSPYTMSKNYEKANKEINKVQMEFGKKTGSDMAAFIKRYTTNNGIHIEDVKKWHGGNLTDLGFQANLEDVRKLKTVEDVVTNTRGYSGSKTNSSKDLRNKVKDAINHNNFVEVLPYGGTYGAQTKQNYFAVDTPVIIRIYDNSDATGSYKDYNGYFNMDWNSESAPMNGTSSDINYVAPLKNAGLSANGREWNRFADLYSLIGKRQTDFDNYADEANVYPVQRNISADSEATGDRYNASQPLKQSTMY